MTANTRNLRIPNANNPALLGRVIELVARGIRSTRSLAEVLGVRERTVRYYLQAGAWLGLLQPEGEPQLTELGLCWAYAEPDERDRVYARAVWATPLVLELMAGRAEGVPEPEEVAVLLAQQEPDLAPSTVRRRASAVLGLLEPALSLSPVRAGAKAQLRLPFSAGPLPEESAPVDLSWGEQSPDVYRFVLCALLDHGELTLGRIRGLLDASDAAEVSIGAPVEQAIRRADATRHGDQLVVTRGALRRRELTDSGAAVALSDPAYRAYLQQVLALDPDDRPAAIQVEKGRRSFRIWDQRILGGPATSETVHRSLDGILLERSLQSFPTAGGQPEPLEPVAGAFLEHLESPITIAAPPFLAQLSGGVRGVNEALDRARRQQSGVGPPGLADTAVAVHGGLWGVAEPLPRVVPDTTSLRLRLLCCCPFVSMAAALLLLHRRGLGVRVERRGEPWHVVMGAEGRGTLLAALDRFASSQGWGVSRRPRGGLTDRQLLEAMGVLGMARAVGELVVLEEDFFARLTRDAEAQEVHDQLLPLGDRLGAWLLRGDDA